MSASAFEVTSEARFGAMLPPIGMGFFVTFLDRTYAGASLRCWLLAAGVCLSVTIGLMLLKLVLKRRLEKWIERTPTAADNALARALQSTRGFFYVGVGLWAGSAFLQLSERAERWSKTAITLIVLIQLGIWLQVAAKHGAEVWAKGRNQEASARTVASAFVFIARLVIWAFLLIMALSSLGFEISALVAGLGVGGVAAALAVQNLLGDLIASLSMFFDRPFDIGDFIVVGEEMGTVERIGLRSTRVRALAGQEIIFANGDLIKSRIHNYRRMPERRISFGLNVDYATPIEDLEAIPGLVRSIIEPRDGLRFDRAHFKDCGSYSLNFEIVYFVSNSDYNVYMDHQQAINLEILRSFRERKIQFALPASHVALKLDASSAALAASDLGDRARPAS